MRSHSIGGILPFLIGGIWPLSLFAEDQQAGVEKQLVELRRAQELLAAQVAELQLEAGDPRPSLPDRFVDLAVVTTVVAGGSSQPDDELRGLQAGGHDPQGRGFNVPNVELVASGAVKDWFNVEVRLVTLISSEGETEIELEEAFVRSTSLPWVGSAMAGKFFTPFGRLNPTHPHAWAWIDQPVINSRVFGADGMRGQGVTADWEIRSTWTTGVLLTVQNAVGETMTSFANTPDSTVAGYPLGEHEVQTLSDLVTTIGWRGRMEIGRALSLRVGADVAYGPNTSGEDTDTLLYGAHVAMRWGADAHGLLGRGGVEFLMEYLARDYAVDRYEHDPDGIPANGDETVYPADTLHDHGVVSQLEVGLTERWSAGLRAEFATGRGESVDGRANDPLRDDRWRLSPLITWQPIEALRLRLQYNLDHADHLENAAHTVWLGLDVLLGHHMHEAF